MATEISDERIIYIVKCKNDPSFSQPYSTHDQAKEAFIKLKSLKPDWKIIICQRVIDSNNFWTEGCGKSEYPMKMITRCFDKEFILLIYFSLLAFLWFKL
jgi:hypothetical protein